MKLLVVGGTGFLGTHILKKAVQLGWNTSSISLSSPRADRKIEHVRYILGDLVENHVVRNEVESISPDYVINCAGYVNHSEHPDDVSKV